VTLDGQRLHVMPQSRVLVSSVNIGTVEGTLQLRAAVNVAPVFYILADLYKAGRMSCPQTVSESL